MSRYQQKGMRHTKKKIGKYDSYTGIEAGKRNCLWKWLDIRFNIKDLKVAIINMFKERKKL